MIKTLNVGAQLLVAAWMLLLNISVHALDGGTLRISPSNGWKAFELISEGDNPAGGENYVMPGTFDGTGALLVDSATLRLQVNHETGDASVSEVDVNLANLQLAISNTITTGNTAGVGFVMAARQAYDRGSSDGGASWINIPDTSITDFYRFCSGQSYEPDTFGPGYGFVDHLYITGEEGGEGRLFVLESAARDFYQLCGVVGDASGVLGGMGGMPYDAFENAALIDTGETQHIALVLSPDGGTARLQLYIGIKGKDVNGNNSNDFLARNGLAYGSYFYFNDALPTITPSTDGFFDATIAGALQSSKLEDVDTSPSAPNRVVLGDQDSGAFVFDINLDFTGGNFNAGASSFSITQIDDVAGDLESHDNVDWTDATSLGGTPYPEGLIFINEDNNTGEIWQMEPDGSNQIKVGETTVGSESSGIFDLSGLLGYKPASVLMTTGQGTPSSLTILISPNAELLDANDSVKNDFDADGDSDLLFQASSDGSVSRWSMQDANKVSSTWLGYVTPATVKVIADLDGDYDADVLFQNAADSVVTRWLMENGAKFAVNNIGGQDGYTLTKAGDLDKDGDSDLVFEDGTGNIVVWLMQGGNKLSGVYLGSWSDYSVKAMADVNNDGDDDLVLGDAFGNVTVVNMQNGAKVNAAWLGTWAGNTVVGAGDADNDGDDDIVMETAAGSVSLIKMQNGAKLSAVWLGAWSGNSIKGIGDIDNDGDADLIQQNTANGSTQVVELQNGAKVVARWLGSFAYSVKGVIDADGDGDVDVAMQDGAGNVALIELEAGSKVGGAKWLGTNNGAMTLFP